MKTKITTKKSILAGMAALVSMTVSSQAVTVVTSDAAGGTNGGSFSVGFRFTVPTDSELTGLGQFDVAGNGFDAAALIAVYNWDTGAKIFESTLAGAVREETGFYDTDFITIPALALTTGTNYLVAVEAVGNDFTFNNVGGSSMTIDPTITWVEGRAGSFTMPATATPGTFNIPANFESYFGPNMKIEAVPEPGSMALLLFGGFSAMMRRRRK